MSPSHTRKPARPTTLPKSFQPNKVIGVDVTYVPNIGGGGVFPVLNVLDWGTNYQMAERLEGKQPQEVWGSLGKDLVQNSLGRRKSLSPTKGENFASISRPKQQRKAL